MKLFVQSFGCQMNTADSEEMARPMLARGFVLTAELEEADAVLLNTCTVRQHAEDRALSLIGRLKAWKEERPGRFLIVAGCAAERTKDWLQKRFPYIDLVAGAKSIDQFPELLEAATRGRFDWAKENEGAWPGTSVPRSGAAEGVTATGKRSIFEADAYVTIMRGCNYTCAYCIVPSVRGREVYRDPETILEEVRGHAARGARSVMLLGQTVNSYPDFANLLRRVGTVEGVELVRFMSPHPHYVDERMVQAMAEGPKTARHLHLPVQSGSDRILKLMRRNYTREKYLWKVALLRRAMPEIALTTDIIVGFPTETEEDFHQTLELLDDAGFDSAFCFKFSSRQGTEAAGMDGQPDEPTKEWRLARLLERVIKGSKSRIR